MKPLSSMLLFAIAIHLYGSTLVLSQREPPNKPMYMVFARHPGKSNKAIKDAPLSGGQNDEVSAVRDGKKVSPAWTSPQALALQTNGLEQMLKVLDAGKHLKAIFQSLGDTNFARWWEKHSAQKEVFQKMKDVFTDNAKYSFETSDLRRAQLEAIALRKSFEDEGIGGNKLKESPFYIVHNMGERWTPGTYINMRSFSSLKPNWFDQSGARFKIMVSTKMSDYQTYLRSGMPQRGYKLGTGTDGQPAAVQSNSFVTVNNKISGYVRSKLLGSSGLLESSGKLNEYENAPQFTTYVYGDTTTPGRLRKDWTRNVDVIVAVGSGGWYKDMVTLKNRISPTSGGCSNEQAVEDKLKRQLDYTEFVLMEWTFSANNHMRIVNAWTASDLRFYDLERWVPTQEKMSSLPLARDEDFGDDNDYQDYAESEEYDDEFDEYDEDNDYSAYDDYNEYDDDFEYYYGEYYGEDDDNDLYEESLYEAALENLIKAQKQFAVAQRLMAPQRRMKAPAHSYH